tara:strand:- start:535 stop:879 length:345 start_codon:yes stop_codon:yes gene_type:complete
MGKQLQKKLSKMSKKRKKMYLSMSKGERETYDILYKFKSKNQFKCKHTECLNKSKIKDVHHILPRNSHPQLLLDYNNLIVLCRDCHKSIHSQFGYKNLSENNEYLKLMQIFQKN